MQVVLSAINSKYIHTGLGLRYVGEYAKAQGHEVTLIEETTGGAGKNNGSTGTGLRLFGTYLEQAIRIQAYSHAAQTASASSNRYWRT